MQLDDSVRAVLQRRRTVYGNDVRYSSHLPVAAAFTATRNARAVEGDVTSVGSARPTPGREKDRRGGGGGEVLVLVEDADHDDRDDPDDGEKDDDEGPSASL